MLVNKALLLNPLEILNKGFSVVKKDDKIIKNVQDIEINDKISITMSQGSLVAKVESKGE